ncbi:16S rRNA (uracil(1498)-N(3))-methyltransferase [Acuticoccus sp. M5D2P5]|uniref:16S rRNA (uracil(1498)-N(3))-methyltransferase n=1 Tax=Acuticoccus kalidii TaxID=2910977 RepID=UPI001F2BCA04|nr:16S rRNA (uracil(1498)-N(3))-methyltransferase [Acuticoccus kalidii]
MSDFNAPRLFVDDDLPGPISFDQRQTNYLKNVMRLKAGDTIIVFNGRDGEYRALIGGLGKKAGEAVGEEKLRPQTKRPSLWYAFAPLKQARLDYMVEKAAEMGAGRLVPVLTQHGQVRRINRDRLTANIVEACEQCGILSVPEIVDPMPLATFLGSLDGRALVVADEAIAGEEGDPIATIRAAGQPLAVLVGPEGGFSEEERALFLPRSHRVSLGPRVLRADTAAVALLALVEAAFPSA